MYGQGLPGHGRRRRRRTSPQQQTHFSYRYKNLYLPQQQNPHNLLPPINPFLQNPHTFPPFHPPQFPTNNFTIPSNNIRLPQQQQVNPETIEKLDKAAVNAHREFLASNESVSAWKVSRAALMSVKAESWESLGFQMQQVPSLNRLLVTQGKINAFIHCFVAVRQITSLYDLEMAICESEGIGRFEELDLGPLLRHPLVVHYFGMSSDVTEVYRITTEEIISYLSEFLENRTRREVKVDTFLEFIAEEQSVGENEKLCVRIQNFGLYIKKLREAKRSLHTVLSKCFENLRSKVEERSKTRPLYSAQKKQLDDHFTSISQRIQSFSSENTEFCGKHVKFKSLSSEDDDSGDDEYEDSKDENNNPGSNTSDLKTDRVSSCPYPSATEEKTRLGLKTEADYAPDGGAQCNVEIDLSNNRKRRSENVTSTTFSSYKLPKRDKFGVNRKNKRSDNQGDQCTYGNSLSNEESRIFVTTWKEACQSNNADEVLERMLQPYKIKSKRRVKELFTTFPFVGLLNAALPKRDKFGVNHKNKHLDNEGDEDTDGYSLSNEELHIFVTTWKEACRSNNANEVFQRMLQFYKTKGSWRMKAMFTVFPFVGLLNAAVSCISSGMWDNMYDTFQVMGQHGVDVKKTDSPDDHISIAVEPANEGASSQKIVKHKQDVTAEYIAKEISGYFEDDILDYKDLTGENKFSLLRKLCKCHNWLIQRYSINEFESLGYGEYFSFIQKYINLLPRALQNFFTGQTYENVALDARLLPLQLDVLLSQAFNSSWENKIINLKTVAELLARQFPSVCFKLMASDLQENYMEGLREKVCKITSNCLLFSTPLLKSNCLADSLVVHEKKIGETSDLDYDNEPKEGLIGAVTTKDAIEVLLKAPMLTDLNLWSHWDLLFAPSLGSITEWLFKEVNTKELLCLATKDGKIIRLDHSATLDSFLKVFIRGSAFETAVQLLSLYALYGGERSVPLSLLKCHAQKAFEVIIKNSSDMELDDNNHKNPLNETTRVVSRFVLDCLSYLPIEFCSFAADILIAGLQSFVKGVPLAILNDCKQIEQRLILHEVGFSLGLVEWVNDYHSFFPSATSEFSPASSGVVTSKVNDSSTITRDISNKHPSSLVKLLVSNVGASHDFGGDQASSGNDTTEVLDDGFPSSLHKLKVLDNGIDNDPVRVIESVREEEFGLGQSLSVTENRMLEKQHARLGRALHCLSQELYSQDSHFLLELVQNADDNIYPGNVEPTLTFILQEKGIVILNNEKGFSANNIRALCDVGNSTKKGYSAGYIGKKGIGFKSVFRVTDAPEIHSNGYHIKFDITQGQIGFVLPSIVPACDVNLYSRLASVDANSTDQTSWNTCIVLPFRSNSTEGFGMNNIVSMFSDLHPSLLLFLHRLQCMKFRNLLGDSLIVMRKQVIGNGMVRVDLGNERMTWLVVSKKLQADVIRSDVQTTEISLAFTLQETEDGGYTPILKQQPVFAFLPLRTYGLKFIIQGDFVLPSSREEVDGNSPWNQWLLSEFPDFFVSAERAFCDLPCYRGNLGKAIAAYMSFIPVVGEVHGFFSSLPRMIVSKLRMSNCLVLEGNEDVWVPPCKVLRNWSEQTRSLLPDGLLQEHIGLGFLNKDIVLSDTLARALGIEDYGPKILLNIISSVSCSENGLKSMGLSWLSSCLSAIYVMLSHSSSETSSSFVSKSNFISNLKKTPFVPVSDGKFCSVDKETVWLHSEEVGHGVNEEYMLKAFPKLYTMLLIVSPNLLSAAGSIKSSCSDTTVVENVVKMLYKVGIQRLSAHEIVKAHILPAISDDKNALKEENLMIEYLSFAMFHLQSNCASCSLERDDIITELRNKCLILTNYGYKRSNDVPIHFSREYNSPIDTNRLVTGLDMKWHELDASYLKHPITNCLSDGVWKWRIFFQDIGVSDFVQIVKVEKRVVDMSFANIKDMIWCRDTISTDSVAKNWESEELCHLLSQLSSKHDRQKSVNLMEILDILWDGYFSDKCAGHCIDTSGESKPFKSSVISILQDIPWVVSSIDEKLHYPKDLFHDCVSVNSVLGSSAPYTTPKVKSEKLVADIGLKTQVTVDDALFVLRLWKRQSPFKAFKASVSQMSNLYEFLWKGMASSKKKIIEELQSGHFVFVPYTLSCSREDVVCGQLLSSQEVYWRDSTENVKSVDAAPVADISASPLGKTLYNLYPTLHDFFVNECGVNENPPLRGYLQILLQLSSSALPHEAGKRVYKVFLKWADALNSGLLSSEDADYLKESLLRKEYAVLPTRLDRWVSLHASFGLVCWCDDGSLGKDFKKVEKVDFLYFGDYTDEENQMLHAKLSIIMRKLGIPALSEIVTREAIYYGTEDSTSIYSMVNWILPYAQRYIYNVHLEKYFQLKQSAFEYLTHLKIVVVEKLFYWNIIKRCDITSKKRHECDCLLQDKILYCSKGSNTHALFLELSRLLYNGAPELHFANFLHMITTMAESGATEEQMESFIQNSQKVPKLPSEESSWSLQSSSVETDAPLFENYIPVPRRVEEQNSLFKRKPGTVSNWPPANWKTAPGFNSSSTSELKKQTAIGMQITEANFQIENISTKQICSEVNTEGDKAVATSMGTGLVNSEILEPADLATILDASGTNMELDSVDFISPEGMDSVCFSSNSRSNSKETNDIFARQAQLTGRMGEFVAFKYFEGQVGEGSAKWVNEGYETGLPYDVVIGKDDDIREYIEVKATKYARKNWFHITMREWQFAIEKGEAFSIAHVNLANDNMARVTVYKNPAKLCQFGNLKLAVVVPKE